MTSEAATAPYPPTTAEEAGWDESRCTDPRSIVTQQSAFEGKTVVITGAGGQFGREGCLYFAKRGARIAALDMDIAALQGTFRCLQEALGKNLDCRLYVCDVTNATQIQQIFDSIFHRFKRVDMLWNNAGYQGEILPTLDYSPVDFALVMNINVTGMFIVMQACGKIMASQQSDSDVTQSQLSIVNTASVAGLRGTPAMIAYASSKAAVLAMTVAASKDLAPHGIRVNCISPALIGPGKMWERQNELHAKSGSPFFDRDPLKVGESKLAAVPLKRLGSVEEVVKGVAFLLSNESSYITGSNLVVDGGLASGIKA